MLISPHDLQASVGMLPFWQIHMRQITPCVDNDAVEHLPGCTNANCHHRLFVSSPDVQELIDSMYLSAACVLNPPIDDNQNKRLINFQQFSRSQVTQAAKYFSRDRMSDRKLRVGVAGLGRMGARHAFNFHARTPRADLVAAFTPVTKEAEWAATNLPGTTVYTDYDEFLKHTGLEAVVIATVTAVHAEEAIKAIEAGKHVLCEKPLSTSVQVVGF